MTPSADLSPPRRPIFFPVVIATVFLTIIAMTGGFVLGERHRGDDRASGGGSVTADPRLTESAPPGFVPPGPFCPQFVRDMAQDQGYTSEIWQVLKIQADNGSLYWICTDAQGGLYYQSHTGDPSVPPDQKTNSLFLPNVERIEKDSYQVVAPGGNKFLVSSNRFELVYAKRDKKPQRNDARPVG